MNDETIDEREHKLYSERLHHDTHSTEELIEEALRVGDPDEHAYLEPVTVLWHRGGTEVLEAARKLCRSEHTHVRRLGADILSQLGANPDILHEERLQSLLTLLSQESDPGVLAATCTALGHLYDAKAQESLSRLKGHPDPDVRRGVAFGLSGDLGAAAIAALIELSTDPDNDVRDWSTFRLGMARSATAGMLDALAARTLDEDEDTRAEAIVGLARNKDQRALEPLIRYLDDLKSEDENWSYGKDLLFEAAFELAAPLLCPVLLKIKSTVTEHTYLDKALETCGCEAE